MKLKFIESWKSKVLQPITAVSPHCSFLVAETSSSRKNFILAETTQLVFLQHRQGRQTLWAIIVEKNSQWKIRRKQKCKSESWKWKLESRNRKVNLESGNLKIGIEKWKCKVESGKWKVESCNRKIKVENGNLKVGINNPNWKVYGGKLD